MKNIDIEDLKNAIDQGDTKELTKKMAEYVFSSDNDLDAAFFLFIFLLCIEELFKEVVVSQLRKGMVTSFLRPDIFDSMYGEMNFLGKIKILEEVVLESKLPENKKHLHKKFEKLIKLAKNLNSNVRNNLFHCKLNQVLYNEKSLLNISNQKDLLKDYFDILNEWRIKK